MRITETALARQHMTPQSSSLFRDSTLDKRLGRSTVAGSLNDQVRFRFDKQGAPSQWGLMPDNQLSADLLASPAGPKLEQKLRAVLATVDRGHAKDTLDVNGIMLADDEEGWAAGLQLMMRDAARTSDRPMARPLSPAASMEAARITANVAGAQAIFGWVQVAPHVSRNLLTSLGSYSPDTSEQVARSGRMAENMGPLLGHELEHRVTPARLGTLEDITRYMPHAWIEEGTATLLEMTQPGRRANVQAWGVSARSHAGNVAAPDVFSVGWKPWHPDESTMSPELEDTVQANYVDSVETLSGLLWLAGVNPTTEDGLEQTERLLQDVEVTSVPKEIARTLIEAWGAPATPARVRELTPLVLAANEPDGIARVQGALQRLIRRP